jgi:hypothetical protein
MQLALHYRTFNNRFNLDSLQLRTVEISRPLFEWRVTFTDDDTTPSTGMSAEGCAFLPDAPSPCVLPLYAAGTGNNNQRTTWAQLFSDKAALK